MITADHVNKRIVTTLEIIIRGGRWSLIMGVQCVGNKKLFKKLFGIKSFKKRSDLLIFSRLLTTTSTTI